jgi:hypothetical protein
MHLGGLPLLLLLLGVLAHAFGLLFLVLGLAAGDHHLLSSLGHFLRVQAFLALCVRVRVCGGSIMGGRWRREVGWSWGTGGEVVSMNAVI